MVPNSEMSNFFAEQGRTRVYAETDFMSVAGKNPRRTPLSEKMAIYGWTLIMELKADGNPYAHIYFLRTPFTRLKAPLFNGG